MITKLLPV